MNSHNLITLDTLPVGGCGIITGLKNSGEMLRRLEDLGFIEGTEVSTYIKSPFGDPTAYLIRNTVIALRESDARKIEVETVAENRKQTGATGDEA